MGHVRLSIGTRPLWPLVLGIWKAGVNSIEKKNGDLTVQLAIFISNFFDA